MSIVGSNEAAMMVAVASSASGEDVAAKESGGSSIAAAAMTLGSVGNTDTRHKQLDRREFLRGRKPQQGNFAPGRHHKVDPVGSATRPSHCVSTPNLPFSISNLTRRTLSIYRPIHVS